MVNDKQSNFTGKLKQCLFERWAGRPGLRHYRGLQCRKRLDFLAEAFRDDFLKSEAPPGSDRCQIPKDVAKLIDHGARITDVGCSIAVLLFDFAEKAASFAKKPEEREC
ncbi:hypothetical protein ACQPTN_21345 [Bradyrhizobium sp. 13971]